MIYWVPVFQVVKSSLLGWSLLGLKVFGFNFLRSLHVLQQ